MITDSLYQEALEKILNEGQVILTRNAWCRTHVELDQIIFSSTPLVTLRKTAWKMAIQEMEWFMSGDPQCPPHLLPWWKHQLNKEGCYLSGYSEQFRYATGDFVHDFDQIRFILDGLRFHANSRRLLMTAWNPFDMANITKKNDNQETPATCHSTLIQFSVMNEKLYMTCYQRSADMLLGVPHNWIQSWALLLWFAHHAKLSAGTMRWLFGNAHVYCHETHQTTAESLLKLHVNSNEENTFTLRYQPKNDNEVFLAKDFIMEGVVPEPSILLRPVLL